MALDHYVSQVHLRNFYPAEAPRLLYATRKSNLKTFRCDSKSVCRTEEGSTNRYLKESRAIEEFLAGVEPAYNRSLDKLRKSQVDQECIYAIAGFTSYVTTCAPAAMRVHSKPLRAQVEASAKLLDLQGVLEKAPPELGSKSLTELIDSGEVEITVDRKFPQAMGIEGITHFQSLFGNSTWEIIHNVESESPFLTSDYPIAIEQDRSPLIRRIIPLAPDLAIRIIPDVRLRGMKPDLSFPHFRVRHYRPGHADLVGLNRVIVRSAEDIVFSNGNYEWLPEFVRKNRGFRIDAVMEVVADNASFLNIANQRIVPFAQPPR